MDIRKKFGAKIAHLRKLKNLTQKELADHINRTIDTVSAIERGKSMPNFQTLEKLADVFDVFPGDLFDYLQQYSQNKNLLDKKNYLICRLDELNEKEIDFILSSLEGIKNLSRSEI